MTPEELAESTAATRQQLAATAEVLLGHQRAAELSDRIALLASHVALVSAQGVGWLSQWTRRAGNAGGARRDDG